MPQPLPGALPNLQGLQGQAAVPTPLLPLHSWPALRTLPPGPPCTVSLDHKSWTSSTPFSGHTCPASFWGGEPKKRAVPRAALTPLLHGADRDSRAARRAPALGPGQSPHQWEPWVPPQSLSRCSGIFRSSRNGFSSQCVKSRGQVTQSGGPGRSVGQCPSCPSLRAAYSPWVPTAPELHHGHGREDAAVADRAAPLPGG